MNTVFALEVAVGELALNLERARLYACIVAFEQVAHHTLVAVRLGITHIHSHQHLCPVLCFGAACARVYLEDSVHRVFLATQHVLQFQFFDSSDGLGVECVHLLFGDEFLLVELEGRVQFVAERLDFGIALYPLLQSLYEFHLCLGTLLVVPKTGSLRAELFFFVLYFLRIDVEVAVELFGALLDFF